jgi:holo-[acyl-carrier protein] synthase
MEPFHALIPPAPAAKVAGLGVDLLLLDRIRCLGGDLEDPFFRRTFTDRETRQASEHEDPSLMLAFAFAGKEAAFKCLGIDGNRVRLNEIEVLRQADGAYAVAFLGRLEAVATARGIVRTHLQLALEGPFVWALAVAERKG